MNVNHDAYPYLFEGSKVLFSAGATTEIHEATTLPAVSKF